MSPLKWLILLSALVIHSSIAAQKKLALIVAIGDYTTASGWSQIASINDIRYIKAALKQNGFSPANIDTLKNEKATRAGILRSLDAIAAKAKAGDIVFLHFATHGQQVWDQPTAQEGKDEEDGFDEALAAWDSKSECDPDPTGYYGENHLRDDDLGKKFLSIRKNIGKKGSLLVLIDACHSGTASRAPENLVSRGYPRPFMNCHAVSERVISNVPEDGFMGEAIDSASNMVVISASGPHQVNYQLQLPNPDMPDGIEQVGSLSYAFYKASTELPAGSDYQLLFDKMKAVIQGKIPEQLPMIEGDTRQRVFSGLFNKEELGYAQVRQVIGEKGFSIDKGLLHNIAIGTEVTIYKTGSTQPFSEGVIEKAGHFQSLGISKKPLDPQTSYRIKLDAVSYGDFTAALSLRSPVGNAHADGLKKQLTNVFSPVNYLSITEKGEMIIDMNSTASGVTQVSLYEKGDRLRWSKQVSAGDSLSAHDAQELLENIRNAIRVKYLRSLEDGGALAKGFKVSIEPAVKKENNSELIMEPNEAYTLKFANDGFNVLFYNIINITPDNEVTLSIPGKGRVAADYFLAPKGKKNFNARVDNEVVEGKEMIKVILSKEPIDLRSIFERKQERSLRISFQEMMDDLFKDSKDERATRSDVSHVNLDEIGIITVGFTVKKP